MLEKYDEALAVVNKLPESSTDRRVVTATIYYHNGDIGASKSIYQQLLLESIQNCGINFKCPLVKIAEKEGNLDKGIKILGTNRQIFQSFLMFLQWCRNLYGKTAEMYARNGMEE